VCTFPELVVQSKRKERSDRIQRGGVAREPPESVNGYERQVTSTRTTPEEFNWWGQPPARRHATRTTVWRATCARSVPSAVNRTVEEITRSEQATGSGTANHVE